MAQFSDLKGQRFGRWLVLSFSHRKDCGKYHYQMFNCRCDCGNERIVESTSLKKGNSVSCGCYRLETLPRGQKSYQWKTNPGYSAIHIWLGRHYGRASVCESGIIGRVCTGNSNTFEWAKLKGKDYERDRNNFIQLCKGCHNSYDMTEETKAKLSNSVRIAKSKNKL